MLLRTPGPMSVFSAARLLQGVLRLAACVCVYVCVCVCVREREGGGTERGRQQTERVGDREREWRTKTGKRVAERERETETEKGGGGGVFFALWWFVDVLFVCFVFCFVVVLFTLFLSLPPPPFSPTYSSLSLSGFFPFPVNPLVYVCLHRYLFTPREVHSDWFYITVFM